MNILTLDIGGSAIKGGYFYNSRILGQKRVPTLDYKGAETVYHQIHDLVYFLICVFGAPDAIGAVSAGDIDAEGTFTKVNNIPALVGMNLKKRLESDFKVPVYLANDAVGALLAEATEFPDTANLTMLTFGTGLGCASRINGKILHDSSSDYGHLPLIEGGRSCKCGQKGCAEAYLNAASLKELARQTFGKPVPLFDLFEWARGWDKEANRVLDQYASWLNLLLHNVREGLSPDTIILGGGIMEANDLFLPRIQEEKEHIAFAWFGKQAGINGARILVQQGGLNHD